MNMEGKLPHILVADNKSSDDSVERIRQWAKGDLCILPESRDATIRRLIKPSMADAVYMTCVEDGGTRHDRIEGAAYICIYRMKTMAFRQRTI